MTRQYDHELELIADYIVDNQSFSALAYDTAYYAFIDSLGCALLALNYAACRKLLGPWMCGENVDILKKAFDIGAMIRWLDFNDTWLAKEWGHPSDNLGGILALGDYLDGQGQKILVKDIYPLMIKAYEIQGVMALENSFNRVGLDHVILVKLATAGISAKLLGADKEKIKDVLSQVFVDGQSLRTYRHAPNTGSRKSWAAADATRRGLELAILTMKGEGGYPACLSAKTWGFYDVLFKGEVFKLKRPFHHYVMENILFKIAFPAEFHAQTAVEAAFQLHPLIKDKFDLIEKIVISTHESAIRIISKTGDLYNPADRDHCLQYMVAIGLLFGELKADHYEEVIAKDMRIDMLRAKMKVEENKQFTEDYLDPEKRSIANSIQIYFKDGSFTEKVSIEYPLGHQRRRKEGVPLLIQKFKHNVPDSEFAALCLDRQKCEEMPLSKFMRLFYNNVENALGNRCY